MVITGLGAIAPSKRGKMNISLWDLLRSVELGTENFRRRNELLKKGAPDRNVGGPKSICHVIGGTDI